LPSRVFQSLGTGLRGFSPATSIDEVRQALERCIAQAIADNCATGYFAALYLSETDDLLQAAEAGKFREPERLKNTIVVFANRYLLARYQCRYGLPTTEAWRLSFEAAQRETLLPLQHLLLGANAHINVDLAPSVVATGLRGADFECINAILAEGVDRIQERLNRSSRLLTFLDRLLGHADERAVIFGIEAFRRRARDLAERLRHDDERQRSAALHAADRQATLWAKQLCKPGFLARPYFALLQAGETWCEPRVTLQQLRS
jgi:hypothetical protein